MSQSVKLIGSKCYSMSLKSLLRRIKKQKSTVLNGTTTLGRLNKETRLLVHNYENLFTLLQTEPGYLSKLLFCMSTLSSNKFMQSAVFALFDWAQNKREEYLLLKLFKTALQEEIDQKGWVQSLKPKNGKFHFSKNKV